MVHLVRFYRKSADANHPKPYMVAFTGIECLLRKHSWANFFRIIRSRCHGKLYRIPIVLDLRKFKFGENEALRYLSSYVHASLLEYLKGTLHYLNWKRLYGFEVFLVNLVNEYENIISSIGRREPFVPFNTYVMFAALRLKCRNPENISIYSVDTPLFAFFWITCIV